MDCDCPAFGRLAGHPEVADGAVGCRYGSCALLGELPDDDETDIDILVVVPSAVSRGAHFFGPGHSDEGGDSQSGGGGGSSSSRVVREEEEEEEEEEERCGAGDGGGGAQESGQRGGATATTAGTSAAAAAQEEKCVLTALLR
eukprot:COSAG01_NODE_34623_length_544_cov_2.240449_1_plen_142_part_01